MSNSDLTKVTARFTAREDADIAIEHLVQKHGIDPGSVTAQPTGTQNSVGTELSGGDNASAQQPSSGSDAALEGEIILSIEAVTDQRAELEKTLIETGGELI